MSRLRRLFQAVIVYLTPTMPACMHCKDNRYVNEWTIIPHIGETWVIAPCPKCNLVKKGV